MSVHLSVELLLLAKETNAQGYHHLEEEGGTMRDIQRGREISSAPRTAHRSAGEEESLQWISAAHCHAF